MRLSSLAAFLALLVAAPLAAKPAPPPPHPALWAVTAPGATLYLFGTIHALPDHYAWENDRIEQAVHASDRLVIEAVIDKDPAATSQLLATMGVDAALPPLSQRVPKKDRAKLAAMIAKSGYPVAALDRLKTWAAALSLAGVTIHNLGVSSDAGVEERLKAEFSADGKPIEGLETAAGQLGFFDGLPEAAQREFLVSVLDEPSGEQEDFSAMIAAWARGDERGIARTFNRDFQVSKVMRDALMTNRNARWADTLQARLATPGTSFVAVGAGHLAGTGSVIERLKAKGLHVERVE